MLMNTSDIARKLGCTVEKTHPLAVGEEVRVLRTSKYGRLFVEGVAHIVEPVLDTPDFYHVQFAGEPDLRQRYVHIEYQNEEIGRLLVMMFDIWRASSTPEVNLGSSPGPTTIKTE